MGTPGYCWHGLSRYQETISREGGNRLCGSNIGGACVAASRISGERKLRKMSTTKQDTMAVPDFTHKDARISELLGSMHEIADLGALGALAEWDQNTALPEGAGEIRGQQMATLQGLLHERWTAPRLGTLLSELSNVIKRSDFTGADRGLVCAAGRAYDHATKLPRELVEEIARVQSASFEAWRRAKEQNDIANF